MGGGGGGEGGVKGVWIWGKREIIYLSLNCHHQNDSCIKTGSDESHFNVSLTARDKVTRQCPQTTTFEENREPTRYRTEVVLLTSLTPYRWAKPAHKTTATRADSRSVFAGKAFYRGRAGFCSVCLLLVVVSASYTIFDVSDDLCQSACQWRRSGQFS